MSQPCSRCSNHNELLFEFTTDILTGTAYSRCRVCGGMDMLSPGGYIDWRCGIAVGSPVVAGSAWTQSVTSKLIPKLSTLTKP